MSIYRYFILSIIILSPEYSWTQNLVLNGSFEDISSCPDDFNQLYKASHWKSIGGTVDLFDTCSIDVVPVPPTGYLNYADFEFGSSYSFLGISFPFRFRSDTIFREYMQGEFVESLKSNNYHVSFYAFTDQENRTNHLGFYFGQEDLDSIGSYPKIYTPQLEIEDWIGGYDKWKLHEGCVNDIEGSTHFIIGNFYPPGEDLIEHPDIAFSNFLYLDNVVIKEIPSLIIEEINLNQGECLELASSAINDLVVEYFIDNVKIADSQFCPEEVRNYEIEQRVKNCNSIVKKIRIKVSSCGCRVYMPNVINPNSNNAANRTLSPGVAENCNFKVENFSVFDRWGGLVYAGEIINFDSNELINGVYVYLLEYNCNGKEFSKTGDFTIIR